MLSVYALSKHNARYCNECHQKAVIEMRIGTFLTGLCSRCRTQLIEALQGREPVTPTLHIRDEKARGRVREITVQIVSSQIEKGEVDPNNKDALREATKKAAWLAWEAYQTAEEFIRG